VLQLTLTLLGRAGLPQVGADAVSHGATGKGNDQVRFELG
jgi:argininosuccinate synthase